MIKSRYLAISCCIAPLLVGCTPSAERATTDTPATQTAGGTTVPTPAPAIALADVAGRWNVRATPVSGADTTPTLYVLTTTADTSGWSITFPNRKPVPLRRVRTSGDSILFEAGPYESVRRKGVQVRTESVLRLQGGNITGSTVAHYATTGADSVLRLRTEGTRAP